MHSSKNSVSTHSLDAPFLNVDNNESEKSENVIRFNLGTSKHEKKKIFLISKITKEHCLNSEFLQSFMESKDSIDNDQFNFDGLINALVNIKQSNTVSAFHLNFLEFKKVLNFKRSQRKTKIDSILKKCKSKFFRAVQEAIKKLTNDSNLINRLPQSFITNINIDYNKEYMNKTILQIYQDLNIIQSENDFYYGIDTENAIKLNQFIFMTYTELFNYYITSQRFKKDCESIREKEGEKFEILYKYVSKIFIHYYSLSKGNKPKKIDENDKFLDNQRSFFNVKKN